MSNLLGVGGECVVIEKNVKIGKGQEDCALRVSKVNACGKMRLIGGVPALIDVDATYNAVNIPDMSVKELNHPNIIKYLDNTLELIDNDPHHVTGNLKFYEHKFGENEKKTYFQP